MAIISTQALVLRRTDFSETSQIAVLLTPDHGQVHVLAKGSRAAWLKPKRAKIESPLDTLTLLRVVYYEKRGDALYVLSETEMIQGFAEARADLPRWHSASCVAEAALWASQPGIAEPALFYAAVRGLVELCGSAEPPTVMIDFFARVLAAVGRTPDCLTCAATGQPLDGFPHVVFNVHEGRGYGLGHEPVHSSSNQVVVPQIGVLVLRKLLEGVKKPLNQVRLPRELRQPLARLLQGMLVDFFDREPPSFALLRW